MNRLASLLSPPLVLVCAVAASVLVAPSRSAAAGLRDQAPALQAVPADASFYVSWLQLGQRVEAMQQTNAWKKLLAIPAVQMGWMQAQTQWQYPTDARVIAVKEWVESDEGQDTLALAKQMASEEIVFYADGTLAAVLEVMMEINSETSRAQFRELRNAGNTEPLEDDAAIEDKLVELLRQHQGELNVPNIVAGFRIQDKALALRLLDVAEEKLRGLLAEEPQVAKQLERTAVDDSALLTFTLTGEMVPWNMVKAAMDDSPEMFELLREILLDKQLVISLGVVDQYVVLAMGPSVEMFASLGDQPLLADTTAFQRLDQHAEEQIVSLYYISGELLRAVGSNERSMHDMAVMAKGMLSLASLPAEQVEAIERDIDALVHDVLDYLPEPGTLAGLSFATDRGYEAFMYNWGEMPATVDATQPLTLVDHVGQDSLAWFVGRGKQSVDGYNQMVDWCRRGLEHFEAVAEQKASPDDWAEYQRVRAEVLPLLARLDEANREYLIPGTADGQGGLVIDASARADQWCDFMPTAEGELPLPTIALVYGVNDASLVKQGAQSYFEVLQQAVDKAHEAEPDRVPAITLTPPRTADVSGGTIYSYPLPAEWGANERLAPNAGLGDSVLVLSLMPELSEKLLAGSRPVIDGPLADFDRPLAAAGHFKFAALIEMLEPWIDYGVQQAIENADDERGGAVAMIGMVRPQVELLLDVLKVYDSYTYVTYRDEDVWVTHAESRIIDLED